MNDLFVSPHSWLNKQMGINKPDRGYFEKGKQIHRIIQDHLIGKVIDERVGFIDRKFEVVEEVDKDKNCEFEFPINSKFSVYGYVDGKDKSVNPKMLLEIKTGTTLWSIGKFKNSIQRKIYTLGYPTVEETLLVTVHSDMDLWGRIKPKKFIVPVTRQDKDDALEFIESAIEIIKSGEFTTDLEDGICRNYSCPYGENCFFK